MTTRDSEALLALLGHEMRAPTGVIGGYLTMLERQPLTPQQTRALEGARRAQQALVEILDDVRRLVDATREEPTAMRPERLGDLLREASVDAAALGVELDVDLGRFTAAAVTAERAEMARALSSLALAVARDHATGVVCQVECDVPPGSQRACLSFFPVDAVAETPQHADVQALRSGLGLRLVAAIDHIRRAGGAVHDLTDGDRPAGMQVELPLAPD